MLIKHDDKRDGNGDIINHIKQNIGIMDIKVLKLKGAYMHTMKLFDNIRNNETRNRNIKRTNELNEATFHKQISKHLKNNKAAPVDALRRPQDGEGDRLKGPLATDKKEIDEILRQVWKSITDGAEGDLEIIADNFMRKYDKHIREISKQT